MTIAHHPGEELLLSYASGASDEAVALLVATHLALCAECRATVAASEAAGGSLLANITPVSVNQSAYESLLARLDEPAKAVVQSTNIISNVPSPLQKYIGADYDKLAWRHIIDGISHYPIPTKGSSRARLIRVKPGSAVSEHTHRGEEWTLVLTGSFSDATGHYGTGDVQSTTPSLTHEPAADPGPVCINLAVTDAPLVFSGLVQKIVGKLHGF